MSFSSFVSDSLLNFTFLVVSIGIFTRFVLFCYSMYLNYNNKKLYVIYLLQSLIKLLFPLHKSYHTKYFTFPLQFIFHLCLIIIPIWYSGHIVLWTISRFGWYWTPLPNKLIDWMTLLVIFILIFFIFRRIFITSYRKQSKLSDYFFLIIVLLPFLSGYFLTHNYFTNISILNSSMQSIHIFTSEIFLIVVLFLFWKPYINDKCTGCAACTSICPTDAMLYIDDELQRKFLFNHYLCTGCGACFAICPEKAIKLKHYLSVSNFFKFYKKSNIHNLLFIRCTLCNEKFATKEQIMKLKKHLNETILYLCPKCKKILLAKKFANINNK